MKLFFSESAAVRLRSPEVYKARLEKLEQKHAEVKAKLEESLKREKERNKKTQGSKKESTTKATRNGKHPAPPAAKKRHLKGPATEPYKVAKTSKAKK